MKIMEQNGEKLRNQRKEDEEKMKRALRNEIQLNHSRSNRFMGGCVMGGEERRSFRNLSQIKKSPKPR